MELDCWEAGMPEVEDIRRAWGGACCSICGQRDCLKGRFSGPAEDGCQLE